MLTFIFILVAVFFFGGAFWLGRLRRGRRTRLEVKTVLLPPESTQADQVAAGGQEVVKVSKSPQMRYIFLGVIAVTAVLFYFGGLPVLATVLPNLQQSRSVAPLLILGGAVLLSCLLVIGLSVLIYKFIQANRRRQSRKEASIMAQYGKMLYMGELAFPRTVYEGNSEGIHLLLKRGSPPSTPSIQGALAEGLPPNPKLMFSIPHPRGAPAPLLEAEILAAGLTIDGDKRQQQPLGPEMLSYHWNCFFPSSGKYRFTLVLRVANSPDRAELGVIEYGIKVTKFAGLTQRQIGVATWITATAGFVSTVVGIFSTLHLFGL